MFNYLLQAAPVPPKSGVAMNALTSLLPIVAVIVIFYFMIMRPQQKKQKEIAAMRDNLKKGDYIMTTGGLKAKVAEIKNEQNEVVLELQDGVKATFDKAAIMEVIKK